MRMVLLVVDAEWSMPMVDVEWIDAEWIDADESDAQT
jgi:hypothetical protein